MDGRCKSGRARAAVDVRRSEVETDLRVAAEGARIAPDWAATVRDAERAALRSQYGVPGSYVRRVGASVRGFQRCGRSPEHRHPHAVAMPDRVDAHDRSHASRCSSRARPRVPRRVRIAQGESSAQVPAAPRGRRAGVVWSGQDENASQTGYAMADGRLKCPCAAAILRERALEMPSMIGCGNAVARAF
jgi:hypothetical protein